VDNSDAGRQVRTKQAAASAEEHKDITDHAGLRRATHPTIEAGPFRQDGVASDEEIQCRAFSGL
jgi:hypothetical protein